MRSECTLEMDLLCKGWTANFTVFAVCPISSVSVGSEVAKHCAKGLHEHLKAVVTASIKFDGTPTSGSLLSASTPAASPQGSTQETIEAAAAGDRAPAEMLTARVDGIEAALKAAFLHTDAQLAQTRSAHEVGTTAVVSLVTAPTLWIGNCGKGAV